MSMSSSGAIRLATWAGIALGIVGTGCAPGDAAAGDAPDQGHQAGGAVGTPGAEGVATRAPTVEHHMHIRSAAGVEVLAELDRIFGTEPESEQTRRPATAADAVEALDTAGVERGVVLSIAYMFGVPDAVIDDERAKVRAENDYVAEQVVGYPDRLVGACSVNPLADYALEEIERCADDPRLAGLKLHFTNSDVQLRDSAHVERLQAVFGLARQLDLPVVAHIRTRNPGYGAEDVHIFIREVLSEAPRLPVLIAHMGGWGGYDEATDEALGAFVDAIEAGEVDRSRVWFGLGAVVFQPAAAGADTTLERTVREANISLAGRIRALGTDRVVFATDWPSWPPIPDPSEAVAAQVRLIRAELPLEEGELAEIFSNEHPVARRGR